MMNSKRWTLYVITVVSLFLVGCVCRYDPVSHEHFKNLKDFHLQFIEDFTEGPGKTWNQEDLQTRCNEGEDRFINVIEYAQETCKMEFSRFRAFKRLHEEFSENCIFLRQRDRFLSAVFSDELKDRVAENYEKAIEGEINRTRYPQ